MDAQGLHALLQAMTELSLDYCERNFGSFTVEFERRDVNAVFAVLKHGDHDPFTIHLGQVRKFREDHPQFA